MVIESLLVIPVATFYLAVMPRRSWTNKFVLNTISLAKHIEPVSMFSLAEIGELAAVISLNDFWFIPKECNRALHKVSR